MKIDLFQISYLDLFDNINISITQPGFYLLSGKSGSGKTTLLHILSGLLTPASGEVLYDECSIANRYEFDSHLFYSKKLGIAFQNPFLIDSYSIYDFLHFYHFSQKEILSILTKLDLDAYQNHKIAKLSQGQKQRVAIALIYLFHPEVILLDEPTAMLDPSFQKVCIELLKELSRKSIVIVASHQLSVYTPYIDGKLMIENHTILFEDHSNPANETNYSSCCFQYSLSTYIQLFILHIKSQGFRIGKMNAIMVFLFSLSLLLFQLFSSINHFKKDYASYYPNLYCLEVSNASIEELIEIGGYERILLPSYNERYNYLIITNNATLKEGNMPKANEILVSDDLNYQVGERIILEDKEYKVAGIIENYFIKDTIYFRVDDYEEGEDYNRYYVLFDSMEKMEKYSSYYQDEYYMLVSNDYLTMVSSLESIYVTLLYYCKVILAFLLFFAMVILLINIRGLFVHYQKEMLINYLHGIRKYELLLNYEMELFGYYLLCILFSLIIDLYLQEPLSKLIADTFTTIPIVQDYSSFLKNNAKVLLDLASGLGILIIGIIGICFKRYFAYSIATRIKEDEGC